MILLKASDEDFLIRMPSYILMTSEYHVSESALGANAAQRIADRPRPRMLIGGLGMAYTLRAALDALPPHAEVTVAELNPAVVRWCRTELAALNGFPLDDPRVTVHVGDVARVIAAAGRRGAKRFDAIVLDLYQGTEDANSQPDHPFYGFRALERTWNALTDDGVLAVWTETSDAGFEKRMGTIGFDFRRTKPGDAGPRHTVYLATRNSSGGPGRTRNELPRGRRSSHRRRR
jgi:spermidine synthase